MINTIVIIACVIICAGGLTLVYGAFVGFADGKQDIEAAELNLRAAEDEFTASMIQK